MANRTIECPTCGNSTPAKFEGIQKCKWCRRLFKVTAAPKRGPWSTEPVDFKDLPPKIETVNNYVDRDIYG